MSLVSIPTSLENHAPDRSAQTLDLHLKSLRDWLSKPEYLIVFGASAGGPAALAEVLGSLPASFPAAIVVIQHVDQPFAQPLADWLASQCALEVRLARAQEYLQAGVVLLPRGNAHLVLLNAHQLDYVQQPAQSTYCPSIDVFFTSVHRHWKGRAAGVLLTGMGRDGAEGLRLMRNRGWLTIAQSPASCALYGMPKAAAEMKAATEILPLSRIAPRLVNLVAPRTRMHV